MECQQCQNLMSEFLEESLTPAPRRRCAEHLIRCKTCRALFDDIRTTTRLCRRIDPIEPVGNLTDCILRITTRSSPLSCEGFDRLLLDYFEGFISASEFHMFEAHFDSCPRCQRLLTSIGSARDLFREVDPVPVPDGFHDRVMQMTSGAEAQEGNWGRLRRAAQKRLARLTTVFEPLMSTEYATAAVLSLATIGLLLVDFSDDQTMAGLYRQAQNQLEIVLQKLP